MRIKDILKVFASTLLLSLPVAVNCKQNLQSYSNNVYVLLSASKFYFNYRHSLNVFLVYKYLKERGITDD